jgi:arsenite methyltransferase
MDEEKTVFDIQAEVGLTKHLGGAGSTDELLALCSIDGSKTVLDVGCGVGVTPCYIAKRYGCRVVGVDVLEGMVDQAIERARREGLEDVTEFRVADAQDLPFEDETFDIVMTESATVFPADKQQAMSEYARVTKPAGYVGLNETTWLKTPVPPELAVYIKRDLSMNAEVQTKDGWVDLLLGAGLEIVSAKACTVDMGSEAKGLITRYGCREILKVWYRMLRLYLRDPDYRVFVKEATGQSGPAPRDFAEYAGYGIYVGQKRS